MIRKKRADKIAAQEAHANDEAKKNNEIAAAVAAKKLKIAIAIISFILIAAGIVTFVVLKK